MPGDILSVAALNKYVHSILESDPFLGDIAIRGEISNLNVNSRSGHAYFSLVDEDASVRAVMFKGSFNRVNFRVEDGMKVLVRCRVTLYEKAGIYQIIVEDMFPAGEGELQKALQEIKEKLEKEGLFAEKYKKSMPKVVKTIGLITSKSGAVLHDILQTAQRRNPFVKFILLPTAVQGFAAAPQIVSAINTLDALQNIDLIIVARGGGSDQDLWVFNSEDIARAAFQATTPLISAIGHETDTTVLDLVADIRASTPTAAAEMATNDLFGHYAYLFNEYTLYAKNIHQKYNSCYNDLHKLQQTLIEDAAVLTTAGYYKQINQHKKELEEATANRVKETAKSLTGYFALADSLNPYNILARGYTIARDDKNNIIKSVKSVTEGEKIKISASDGVLNCTVNTIAQE